MLDELRPYIDVNKVGCAIVKHAAETKDANTRFACRFVPIDIMCKSKIEDLKGFARPILEKYFTVKKEQEGEGG
jgi:hypothetical protein